LVIITAQFLNGTLLNDIFETISESLK
jgi:hypothetical protein